MDKNASDSMIAPASPCINVCTIDEESGYCLGCARSLREIAAWRRLDAGQKQQVLATLPDRRTQMEQNGADYRWR